MQADRKDTRVQGDACTSLVLGSCWVLLPWVDRRPAPTPVPSQLLWLGLRRAARLSHSCTLSCIHSITGQALVDCGCPLAPTHQPKQQQQLL
jgi:hypothetical protein